MLLFNAEDLELIQKKNTKIGTPILSPLNKIEPLKEPMVQRRKKNTTFSQSTQMTNKNELSFSPPKELTELSDFESLNINVLTGRKKKTSYFQLEKPNLTENKEKENIENEKSEETILEFSKEDVKSNVYESNLTKKFLMENRKIKRSFIKSVSLQIFYENQKKEKISFVLENADLTNTLKDVKALIIKELKNKNIKLGNFDFNIRKRGSKRLYIKSCRGGWHRG
jgi:hypothetical protein